jgi:hypothetical protein
MGAKSLSMIRISGYLLDLEEEEEAEEGGREVE